MTRKTTPSAKAAALNDQQFLAISRALSDPRRFAILQQVAACTAEAGMPCSALQEHAFISPATISHHMKELSEAGLVVAERNGRCANLTLQRSVWQAYLKRLSAL